MNPVDFNPHTSVFGYINTEFGCECDTCMSLFFKYPNFVLRGHTSIMDEL